MGKEDYYSPFRADPETSRKIIEYWERERRRNLLEERLSRAGHAGSEQGKKISIHLAEIAIPKLLGEERGVIPHEELLRVFGELERAGYAPDEPPVPDIHEMDRRALAAYFIRVVRPEIGLKAMAYDPDACKEIMAKSSRHKR